MSKEYDLVVLGGGTGGYIAAIRASQLGLKTALVEKAELGGTCLHRGCIPSKALLRSAEVLRQTKEATQFGVDVNQVTLNFTAVQARKTAIVAQLEKGVQYLIKKNKIDFYAGKGTILGPSIFSPMAGTISVQLADDELETLIPKNVMIATGSQPRQLGELAYSDRILSSEGALQLETLPKEMVIVGGGVIGMEWASLLHDLGVQVTVIEYGPTILPTEDAAVARELTRLMKKRGITIVTKAAVDATSFVETAENVSFEAVINDKRQRFTAEKVLISVGREAVTANIGLENTAIQLEQGAIKVNANYQTKESHIYAVGDCIGGLQLAHVAMHEGIHAVEHIAGVKTMPIKASAIARCVYTYPEVASIGLTEAEAAAHYDIKTGEFPFSAVGKALVYGETDGFVKVIADANTNDVLGVHMIGPHVTDLISEAGLAFVLDATPWEIAATIHPHPTLSEAFGEAALAVDGHALQF
ncbi:dihydrolipoyl dehydrogenase [Brochothrix campestris]|uniref:Dihydrolipoyl dehydrogenase n=1 Tax=Brochothrix campestris FSL F6-1037 TaxID=1265861 RepID=W7CNH3_9LIST|nr:dihydrolipoyl dehydrogenase [Brochothrix campestris]EUJ38240.1 dihydrolipoamide dehydrogenase [Brochothrix campestris FSL F6-1037]